MNRPSKIIPLSVVMAVYRKGETAGIYPAWKRWGTKALVSVFLSCLLGPAAHAQEASGDRTARANPAASDGRAGPDCVEKVGEGNEKPQCISGKVKSLRLSPAGRFARGLQYEYKLIEQPGTVFVSSGTGAGAVTAFLRNPQDYLQQHSLIFKFGELFPDRLSIFKRGSDYLKKNPGAADEELSEILCGPKPLITCLAKGGRWWQRALMGTSANLNFSQRALVQQGIIASPSIFGKKYQVNGGFVFDPAKLFPTATNWKSTFDDVQKVDKALAYLGASDVVEAIEATSGRRPWKQPWAAAVIPKVEFKILSQFDFLKFEGALIEAPFPERALNTWTFTWDLTRAIPDTRSRTDADAIDQAIDDLRAGLGRKEEPTWQKQCVLNPAEKDRFVDVQPSFPAEACRRLAQALAAKKYELSCVFRKGASGEILQRSDGTGTDPTKPAPPPAPNECKW